MLAPMRALASYERRDILTHCVTRFTERKCELAEALCIEAGKPIRDSRGEVDHSVGNVADAGLRADGLVADVDAGEVAERLAPFRLERGDQGRACARERGRGG